MIRRIVYLRRNGLGADRVVEELLQISAEERVQGLGENHVAGGAEMCLECDRCEGYRSKCKVQLVALIKAKTSSQSPVLT